MRRSWMVLLPLLLFVPSPAHAASYCDGYAYLTRGAQLLRFDPGAQTATLIGELPYSVNALAAGAGELYGIARPHGQAVKVTSDGSMVELGQIRGGPAGGFNGAYVAAISGDSWLLMYEGRIYTIALDGLKVVAEAPLSMPLQIGDWAADARGRLATISTHGAQASLVSIDPGSGQVDILAQPTGLPSDSVYGAVWIQGNDLYAWHNSKGTIYRLDLAQPGDARAVLEGLAADGIDAASCEPTPPPGQAPPVKPTQPPPATRLPAAPLQAAPHTDVTTIDTTTPATPTASPSPTTATTSPAMSGPFGTPAPKEALPKVARADGVPVENNKSIYKLLAAGAGVMMFVLLLGLRSQRRRG